MSSKGRLLYAGMLPPHPGGSAIWAGELLPRLAAKGFEIRAIAPFSPKDRVDVERFSALNPAIDITRFEVALDEAKPWWKGPPRRDEQTCRVQALIDEALRGEPTQVLLTERKSFILGISDVLRRHDIRWAATIHSDRPASGGVAGYERPLLDQLGSELRHADVVIAVAKWAVANLVELGLDHVTTIPNGVDTDRFCPAGRRGDLLTELHLRESDIVVGHFSTLKPVKRPLDIVEAAAKAAALEPRLRFLIVGDGACRKAMERACRDRAIEGIFRFAGWIGHDEVPDYLRLTDLVVMPSEGEAKSLACLEAMACRCVLLASDIPAAREIVDNGRTGFLFHVGAVGALAALLVQLAAGPKRRREVGKAARDEVVRRHNLADMVDRYVDLLAELCRT